MELCISLNILCSVENPENSLFWEYPDIKRVIGKGFFTEFHNCMHGGKRRKSTSWWATKTVFNELQSICDNSHQHSSWAPTMTAKGLVFPTAEEAAYPELLCKRVASRDLVNITQMLHAMADLPIAIYQEVHVST